MTFEELERRMAHGERIGRTIDVHDAIATIMHELRRVHTARQDEPESTEEAWEHEGEECREPMKP